MARSALNAKEAGFTLVELLVVVFIIGLMAGIVVVNLPRAAPPAEAHARAISRALHQATRESIISGQALAWSTRASGEFRFERYIAGEWEPVGRSAGQTVSAGPALQIEVEYPDGGLRPVEAMRRSGEESGDTNSRFVRRVVFSPVGEATPAQIRVRSSNAEYTISVRANGDVEWLGTANEGGL